MSYKPEKNIPTREGSSYRKNWSWEIEKLYRVIKGMYWT